MKFCVSDLAVSLRWNSGVCSVWRLCHVPNHFTWIRHSYVTYCLILLSRFSHVRLCDPTDGSPPGSPSLGFSRQEHWSGLPFPSPMQESEKWKWSHSVVSDSSGPHGLQPLGSSILGIFPGKSTGVGCHRLLRLSDKSLLNSMKSEILC